LVSDLLELSRLDAGERPLAFGPVLLEMVARQASDAIEPRAAGKRVTIQRRIPGDLTVRADPKALEQVLLNLLDNAIKYTPESGSVVLSGERAGDKAQLSVRDTGLGIDSRHLPRLFERFYRVDRGRSREAGGTGLGLSIVRHLVHAMDGDVRVTSQLGVGSTFTVVLPLWGAPMAEGGRAGLDSHQGFMPVAILADVHGNLPACEAVLADIARCGADVVVAAGDLALRGAHPRETVELLFDKCQSVLIGNTDCYIAGNYLGGAYREREHWKRDLLQWTRDPPGPEWTRRLGELPFSVRYCPRRGQDLYVCHANPRNLEESVDPTLDEPALRRFFAHLDVAACAFGHLHFPYRRRYGRMVIADVASAGIPRDGDARPAYGIFTWTPRGWRVRVPPARQPRRRPARPRTGGTAPPCPSPPAGRRGARPGGQRCPSPVTATTLPCCKRPAATPGSPPRPSGCRPMPPIPARSRTARGTFPPDRSSRPRRESRPRWRPRRRWRPWPSTSRRPMGDAARRMGRRSPPSHQR